MAQNIDKTTPDAKAEGGGAPEIEITSEMVDAAMRRLWQYPVASEYVDRDMMTEILRAALSGAKGAF
jgi:hypothetical protein